MLDDWTIAGEELVVAVERVVVLAVCTVVLWVDEHSALWRLAGQVSGCTPIMH